MSNVELKVKSLKIVEDPKMSLTMMGRLVVASERVKLTIIKKSKYPPSFVPGYYEIARKCLCDTFAGNIYGDYDLYFEEFKRKAKECRKAASVYPKDKVMYKNNFYSALSLEGVIVMVNLIIPLLETYTYYSNLAQNRNSIMLNGVKIGAMADMILYDRYGLDCIGFLKFNFSKSKFPADEAAVKLKVLKNYYDGKNIEFKPENCILIDVPARRIYTVNEVINAAKPLDNATILIRDTWGVI